MSNPASNPVDEYRKCDIGNCCMRAIQGGQYCEGHTSNADTLELLRIAEVAIRTQSTPPTGWLDAVRRRLADETSTVQSIGQRMRDLLVIATPHGFGQPALNLIREWDALHETFRDCDADRVSTVVGDTPDRVVVGEPLAASCYVTSGPHLSGHRVCIGFKTMEAASKAHQRVSNLIAAGRSAQKTTGGNHGTD